MATHPDISIAETEPAKPASRGEEMATPTLEDLRRHIGELCVRYEITPLLREPDRLRLGPGSRAVALRYIGDVRGYWACLYDIGLAIADSDSGASRCELAAWAWASQVALAIPTVEVRRVIAATRRAKADGIEAGPRARPLSPCADACRARAQ